MGIVVAGERWRDGEGCGDGEIVPRYPTIRRAAEWCGGLGGVGGRDEGAVSGGAGRPATDVSRPLAFIRRRR